MAIDGDRHGVTTLLEVLHDQCGSLRIVLDTKDFFTRRHHWEKLLSIRGGDMGCFVAAAVAWSNHDITIPPATTERLIQRRRVAESSSLSLHQAEHGLAVGHSGGKIRQVVGIAILHPL